MTQYVISIIILIINYVYMMHSFSMHPFITINSNKTTILPVTKQSRVYHIIQWLAMWWSIPGLLYLNAWTSKELQSSDETALAGEMFYANTFDFDEIEFNTFNMSQCTPICCFRVFTGFQEK